MPADNEHKLETLQRPRGLPSAGVMLVLGSFVEDKLWSGIIVKITILCDRWGLYTACPLWVWGDRIFRLVRKSHFAPTACWWRTSFLRSRNRRTFNPRSSRRRGLGITGRKGCERCNSDLHLHSFLPPLPGWDGPPGPAAQHTHVHCSLRWQSPNYGGLWRACVSQGVGVREPGGAAPSVCCGWAAATAAR